MTAKEREQYERQADIELKNYRKEIAQYHEKRDKQEHEMSSSASAAAAAPSPAVNIPMAAASAASFSEQTPSASAFLQRTAQPTTVAKAVAAPSAVQTLAPIAAQFADLNTQNIAAAALLLNNSIGSVNLANAGMPGLHNTILQIQAAQLLAQMGQASSLNVQDLTVLAASLQGGYSLPGNQPNLNQLLTVCKSLYGAIIALLLKLLTGQSNSPYYIIDIFLFSVAMLQQANQPPTMAQFDPAPALVQPPPVPQPLALQANEPNMANLLSNLGDETQRALLEQLLEVQRNRQSSDGGQQAGDAPPQSPGSS